MRFAFSESIRRPAETTQGISGKAFESISALRLEHWQQSIACSDTVRPSATFHLLRPFSNHPASSAEPD